MLQRIQSIFLLVCGGSFFGLFGIPFASSSVAIPNLLSDMTYNIQDSPLLIGLSVLGGLVSIIATSDAPQLRSYSSKYFITSPGYAVNLQ